jgi:hypothetical protein
MERNIQLGKLDKQTYLTCYNICNAESKWVGGTPPRVAVTVYLNCGMESYLVRNGTISCGNGYFRITV